MENISMGKTMVHRGEAYNLDKKEWWPDLTKALDDLQEKLLEQDMYSAMFQSANGISADVYKLMRDDFAAAFRKCTGAKRAVTKLVMERYEAAPDTAMNWNYDYMNEVLTVYA